MPSKRVYFLSNVQQIIILISILNQKVSQAGLVLWARDPGHSAHFTEAGACQGPTCHPSCQSRVGRCPGCCSAGTRVCTESSGLGARETCSPWGPERLLGGACCGSRGPGVPADLAAVTTSLGLSFLICQARIVMPPWRIPETLLWGQKGNWEPRRSVSWRGRRQRTRREAKG